MKRKSRIITLAKYEPLDLTNYQIRLELNEAKWVALWSPTHSKVKVEGGRRIERKISDTDIQAITVYYISEFGTLTTDDLKTYLALILIWEREGRPIDRPVPFSLAQLARIRGIAWNAKNAAKLRQSLNRLQMVPMRWENAFYHKPSDQILTVLTPRHILSYLVFGEKRKKGKKVSDQERGTFKFDQHVLDNLTVNYSKPVHIDDALALNNEIAILLFMHLGVVMADKPAFERNSAELFRDLGLQEQKKYKYPSGRKQALQQALKELRGKRLSTGVITKIELVSNIKGNDFKLRVRKGKLGVIDTQATAVIEATITEASPQNEQMLSEEQQALVSQLQKDFSVTKAKATMLATHYLEATKQQLSAWPYRDQLQIQDKAGWIIRAIEQGYELPQAYLEAVKERKQRERLNRAKEVIAACSLCDESGFRMIMHDGVRTAKRCSHDLAIESRYSAIESQFANT